MLLLYVGLAQAGTLTGRVVAISDGDTITVLDHRLKQHKVRLAGIDSPEKAQPFGNRAKQYLSQLIYQKEVNVEWRKYDRYGRIVGKILVAAPNSCPPVQHNCPRNLDVGLSLVAGGLAWHYKQYAKEQPPEDRERNAIVEQGAKVRRVALWGDKNPVPPWQWRHERR